VDIDGYWILIDIVVPYKYTVKAVVHFHLQQLDTSPIYMIIRSDLQTNDFSRTAYVTSTSLGKLSPIFPLKSI
jgi:hypothetical protein